MRKYFLFLFLLFFVSISCCYAQIKNKDQTTNEIQELKHLERNKIAKDTFYTDKIAVDKNNVPTAPYELYFPTYFFPEVNANYIEQLDGTYKIEREVTSEWDLFVMKWYSDQLRAFKEPLLFNKKSNKETYRFTWLRTFHNPVVIRIEKDENNYTLTYKVCDRAGGYQAGNIKTDKTIEINSTAWNVFIQKIEAFKFWNCTQYGRLTMGTDGSEWILEGSKPTKYKVLTEWSPNSGLYREACLYLLSLTGLDIKEIY